MKTFFHRQAVLAILLLCYAATVTAADSTAAETALARYLAMPGTSRTNGDRGASRSARLNSLASLASTPNALATVQAALPSITNAWQRAELAEMLGRNLQNKDSASILVKLMNDADESVRGAALHGLRLMACRIDRRGRQGIQPEPAHPPKVDGLLPTLISTASDPSAQVRLAAIYALADTREPLAITEIREHLQDAASDVRFHAACTLAEVHDASGISQLKTALAELRHLKAPEEVQFYLKAEPLLLAFERLTGKSFGEIPMNPMLSSNLDAIPQLSDRYSALIKAWSDWWAWSPAAN